MDQRPNPTPTPPTDQQDFAARRRRLAEQPDDERRLYRSFFYEIDYQSRAKIIEGSTSLPHWEGEERAKQVDNLRSFLCDRVVSRAVAYEKRLEKPTPWPPTLPRYGNPEAVLKMSSVIRGIATRLFWGNGGLDMASVERAFEKFANGELRLVNPAVYEEYESDSGLYFTFAEFALVAIELDIDREFWERLLNVLVRSQEVFVAAYPPSGPRRRLRAIVSKFRSIDFRGSLSESELEAIRDRYRPLKQVGELAEASARIASFALREGRCPPREKATAPAH